MRRDVIPVKKVRAGSEIFFRRQKGENTEQIRINMQYDAYTVCPDQNIVVKACSSTSPCEKSYPQPGSSMHSGFFGAVLDLIALFML